MNYENMTTEELIKLEDEERSAYYDTKRFCNYSSDISTIIGHWNNASAHWDKANEILKVIKTRQNQSKDDIQN